MAGKRRFAGAIVALAALAMILIGLSYLGVHHYSGSQKSEQSASAQSESPQSRSDDSAFTESTNETNENAGEATDQAPDASEAQSANPLSEKDSEAPQGQQESAKHRAAEGEDEDEADPDELRIAGAVLDDAGQPLEGASVVAEFASSFPQEETAPVSAIQHSETTDRLGTFEFRNLDEGEYELAASKGKEYLPAQTKVRTGMANVELTLQRLRPVRIYGTVSDEQGEPLDAVTVRAMGSQLSVQSSTNGGYEIVTTPTRAGEPPVLEFKREGFQETRRPVKAALNSDLSEVQLDVQMEADSDRPKVAVAGQVLGPIGEAVVGARVRLKSFKVDGGHSAGTDESGEFNIPTVEVGEGYRLNVMPSEDYEAYESEVFTLGPEDAFFEIELESAKFASLSGTVMDLYGDPLPGFQLWLRGIGASAQPRLSVRTDGAGRFRLEQLRAGEVALETHSLPMLRASGLVLEAGEDKDVDVPLDWGTDWLFGRVVDFQGEPVSGASIIVTWKADLGDLVSESRRDLRSDLEGYFAVSNLDAEYYTLIVQAPGYSTFRGEHQLGRGAEELVIQLQ